MELGSALELQSKALQLIYEMGAKSARVFPAYSTKVDASPHPDDIAVGVSRRADHEFRLAIRIQGRGGDTPPLVDALSEMARGRPRLHGLGQSPPTKRAPDGKEPQRAHSRSGARSVMFRRRVARSAVSFDRGAIPWGLFTYCLAATSFRSWGPRIWVTTLFSRL
jgi:hypothetical protein